ncbi:MAG: putative rane protein [Anaerocolumna sp.]|nr:putative rane protein [Anaerocolumna sp.]
MIDENTIKGGRIGVKYIAFFVLYTVIFLMAFILLKQDFRAFITWWLVLAALGIGFMPITYKIFSSFHDNGYLFSKIIGLAISGYLMWFLSSIKLVKFTSFSCLVIVVITFIINGIIFYKEKDKKELFSKVKLDKMLLMELLFLVFFLLWVYIRGFKPEAHGTEKFMDYGFMASMMRSDYMPPSDLWYAGGTINYYYVGQYMATFLTKLSFLKVEQGYNLMMMTLAAMSFVLPYALIYQITKQLLSNRRKKYKLSSHIAGLLSGAGVCFAGNIHFTIFYWILPGVRNFLGIEGEFDKYWFPNSTRYIGYNPETNDKTIHEYPSYSFILGDLHAHVLNIIFVITLLGILFAYLTYQYKRNSDDFHTFSSPRLLLREVCNPFTIFIGFLIGLFHTTNFWDFPIYYVVSGAVILFSNLVLYNFKRNAYLLTALQGIFIIALGEIIALPFTLNFDQISTQISLTTSRTPIYQFSILWGLPATLIVGLLIELIMTYRRNMAEVVVIEEMSQTKKQTAISKFLRLLDPCDMFVLILGLCALGLILLPEVIYIIDIYSGDYKRANTMFKLTYQAFIMFGICSGYIFIKFIRVRKFIWQIKFTTITLLLFLSTLWYSVVSVNAWYGNIFKISNYKGLDAIAFMEKSMSDDYEAVKWLNENVNGISVVLEANGDSYSDNERISMATGLPTVLGWYVHEWLWRGDTTDLESRIADIETIYTSKNLDEVRALIDKYNIEYIYVGKLELDKFESIDGEFIKSLGDVVFMSEEQGAKNYESFLVHIEPKG